MPSVSNSAKIEKQSSLDTQEPLKQVHSLVEKKIRNLEKRKTRLEQLREEAKSGKELHDDQKKAVNRYDEVIEMLDFFKEFSKNVNNIFTEHSKQMKKLAKKEQSDRKHQEMDKLKSVILYQTILNKMGEEEARSDFLRGTNGATQLTEEKLTQLDELYKIIYPERSDDNCIKQAECSAERLMALVEGFKSEAFKGTSYKELKEIIVSINKCGYFEINKSATVSHTSNTATAGAAVTAAVAADVQVFQAPQPETTAQICDLQRGTKNVTNYDSSSNTKINNETQSDLHQTEQSNHQYSQNKPRTGTTNTGGSLNHMINPSGQQPTGFNFLQEPRLEMEGAPHMDPAVVAMAPIPGTYNPPDDGNRSVEALTAQLASIPMSSSSFTIQKVPTTYESNASHQPIPTQTFTNQNFAAMMAASPFVPTAVTIGANTPMLGLPVQHIPASAISSHHSASDVMTASDPNQNQQQHLMSQVSSQQLSSYQQDTNYSNYQPDSMTNQTNSRDKQNYHSEDGNNFGQNFGRSGHRRPGRGGSRGGGNASGYGNLNGFPRGAGRQAANNPGGQQNRNKPRKQPHQQQQQQQLPQWS